MSKPRQTGNNKPVPATKPAPPPPPSVDRLLIGTDQRSIDPDIARKVIEAPEKK